MQVHRVGQKYFTGDKKFLTNKIIKLIALTTNEHTATGAIDKCIRYIVLTKRCNLELCLIMQEKGEYMNVFFKTPLVVR